MQENTILQQKTHTKFSLIAKIQIIAFKHHLGVFNSIQLGENVDFRNFSRTLITVKWVRLFFSYTLHSHNVHPQLAWVHWCIRYTRTYRACLNVAIPTSQGPMLVHFIILGNFGIVVLQYLALANRLSVEETRG